MGFKEWHMTDIVIPLGSRSYKNYTELRYCLRSLEKHLKGMGNVYVIGECPNWISGVYHLNGEDDARNRFRDKNILNKMITACKDEWITSDFIMVHDDHYLLQDIQAKAFPYVHHGPINIAGGQYGYTKQNTIGILGNINDHDSHCPILFNKKKFLNTVPTVDWSKWYGYLIKTLYCVMNEIQAEYYPDLKIRWADTADEIKRMIEGRKWFSIGDRCFDNGAVMAVLQELYPNKSKYEA
jgi:hypothetical protein